jgi:hypothetical protein
MTKYASAAAREQGTEVSSFDLCTHLVGVEREENGRGIKLSTARKVSRRHCNVTPLGNLLMGLSVVQPVSKWRLLQGAKREISAVAE